MVVKAIESREGNKHMRGLLKIQMSARGLLGKLYFFFTVLYTVMQNQYMTLLLKMITFNFENVLLSRNSRLLISPIMGCLVACNNCNAELPILRSQGTSH